MMAELIEIVRVVVGTEYFTATVRVAEDAPLMTSEDLEGTTRVYNLMPQIINHACMGDAGEIFRDCMGDTEVCHLLEHMTVELLSRTSVATEVIAGRTWRELAYERTYSIQLPCIDDVLVAGALSSAIWIFDWAFTGGTGPVPDVGATVAGLEQLALSLPVQGTSSDQEKDDLEDFRFEDYDEGRGTYDDRDEDYADDDLDRGPRMSRKII